MATWTTTAIKKAGFRPALSESHPKEYEPIMTPAMKSACNQFHVFGWDPLETCAVARISFFWQTSSQSITYLASMKWTIKLRFIEINIDARHLTALLPKVDVSKTQPKSQPIVPLSHSPGFSCPSRDLLNLVHHQSLVKSFSCVLIKEIICCYIEHCSNLPSVSSQGILCLSASIPLKRKVEFIGSSGNRQRCADLAPRNTLVNTRV